MTIMALNNKCVGCTETINDMYYLIVGSNFYWHLSCLKCSDCSCSLQSKCYMNQGKFYCLNDYTKLKQSLNTELETISASNLNISANSCNKRFNCPTCHQGINSNDYVIKLRNNESTENAAHKVYHLNCFLCAECHKLIAPGHQYAIINEKIFCSQHYFTQISSQPHLNVSNYMLNKPPLNSTQFQSHQQYHQMLSQNHLQGSFFFWFSR